MLPLLVGLAAAEQTVTVAVSSPVPVQATVRWLGEERAVPLSEDGGVWRGSLTGADVRYLPVRLTTAAGEAYSGIALTEAGQTTLSYSLEQARPPLLLRQSSARTIPALLAREAGLIGAQLAAGVLTLIAVLLLGTRRDEPAAAVRWPGWASPLLWLILAIVWTWPAVLAGDAVVGRHFDTQGTVWSLSAAPRLLSSLTDPLTGWPDGADYTRLDSFVLVLLGGLLQFLDPVRLHGWLQPIGVAASAWAAERLARGLGARAPWSLAAGVLFAFSGLAANALLEGHVYHLLDPWLPLMTLCWWRALSPAGRWWHGAGTAALFAGALLSTGYLGLSAAVILAGLFVGALLRRPLPRPAPVIAAVAGAAPVVVAYGAVFAGGDGGIEATAEAVRMASAHLASLAGPTPEVDLKEHALALAISPVMLSLVVLSGAVLPRRQRWRALLWTGLAGLLLAMGPAPAIGSWQAGLSLPEPLLAIFSVVRFPARLSWIWLLCWSALAARVLAAVAGRSGRAAWLILAIIAVEATLLVRLPARQVARPAAVAPLYAASDGPVLDLFPEAVVPGSDLNIWFSSMACADQAQHGRAIADDCVATGEGPRVVRSRSVLAALSAGEGEAARQRLAALGFSTLMLHPDLFAAGDRARILASLPEGVAQTGGGEALVAVPVDVPWRSPTPPEVTLRALRVQLVGGADGADYTLRLGGEAVALDDLGGSPGERMRDGVWTGVWTGEKRGSIPAALLADGAAVWEGALTPWAEAERLVLRMHDGAVTPVIAAPVDAMSSPTTRRNGPTAQLGWLVFAAVALLGRLWIRR